MKPSCSIVSLQVYSIEAHSKNIDSYRVTIAFKNSHLRLITDCDEDILTAFDRSERISYERDDIEL